MADRILRARRVPLGIRGKRRETEWFASANSTAPLALPASSFVFDQSLTTAEKAKRPFTVTRTVGSFWVRTDQVASTEDPFGAIGFMVVSDKASATGVTALPDPITQEASDEWFVYQAWAAGLIFASSTGITEGLREYKFDSRAQRKVQDGEDIVVMVANASAADGCSYIVKFRLLIKVS